MKVRQGFVSNSSSSSFCIYGICVEDIESLVDGNPKLKPKIYEKYVEEQKKWGEEILPEEEYFENVDSYDLRERLEYLLGMEIYKPGDWGCFYIGDSWSSIGDDETGKQFKERVEKELKETFGEGLSFSTHEEGWMDC